MPPNSIHEIKDPYPDNPNGFCALPPLLESPPVADFAESVTPDVALPTVSPAPLVVSPRVLPTLPTEGGVSRWVSEGDG